MLNQQRAYAFRTEEDLERALQNSRILEKFLHETPGLTSAKPNVPVMTIVKVTSDEVDETSKGLPGVVVQRNFDADPEIDPDEDVWKVGDTVWVYGLSDSMSDFNDGAKYLALGSGWKFGRGLVVAVAGGGGSWETGRIWSYDGGTGYYEVKKITLEGGIWGYVGDPLGPALPVLGVYPATPDPYYFGQRVLYRRSPTDSTLNGYEFYAEPTCGYIDVTDRIYGCVDGNLVSATTTYRHTIVNGCWSKVAL